MKRKDNEELIKELQGINGGGDLAIGIYCTKCNAQFELGKQGVAMAWIMGASFMEYVRCIQSTKCPKCSKNED